MLIQFSFVFVIFGLLIFIFIADAMLDYLLRHSFIGTRYRLFVAPGIIIHELSHALTATLLGIHVQKINVFAADGGYIIHTKPRQPFIQTLISLAPIFGVMFVFILITYLLQPIWLSSFQSNLQAALHTISETSLSRWQTWLHIYLSLSLATSLAPSWQDLKIALPEILIIMVLLLLVSITPLGPQLYRLLGYLMIPFLAVIIFLIFSLILSAIIYFISRLYKPNLRYFHF